MKKILQTVRCKLIGCICISLLTPALILSQPPTQQEILASIDRGVAWMASQQNDDGSWADWERVAHTGFALTKLCDYAYEQNYISPFDPDYEYHENVIAGFDYLFSQAKTYDEGPWIYILEGDDPHHETYNTAIALMAIASCYPPDTPINFPSNPVLDAVPTFADLVNEIVAYFEWSQNDESIYEGSWGYHPNFSWPEFPDVGGGDNSHTGYVVLALSYAEAYGTEIPQSIKDKLTNWIDYIQNDDIPTDPEDPYLFGGSGYQFPYNWVTSLKTGNLLFEMAFCGDDLNAARVQNALGFLSAHWNDSSSGPDCSGQPAAEFDYGWQEHLQAMYCLMKGFESYSIDFIQVDGIDRNWYEEFTTYIVGAQQTDGRWLKDNCTYWGWNDLLNTFWALLVLEKVSPPPSLHVDFDIHPTSWPNPINVNSVGLVPTAILGTEDFDVTSIDPTTLLLEGVAPLFWAIEDVTQPAGNDWECNDTEQGPDGYYDLTIKFNTQELVTALGGANDGDEMTLTIAGNLMNGLNIEGNDCIIIKNKGLKSAEIISSDVPADFSLDQIYPNPVRTNTTIKFGLPADAHVTLFIYDVLGNVVVELTNKDYKMGYYEIIYDTGNLAEGIYLIRLEANQNSAYGKMIKKN
jgi:hypothetical protein